MQLILDKAISNWLENGLSMASTIPLTLPRMRRKIPSPMLKYLYRGCPKCGDYLGVVVTDPPEPMREIPIDAHCVVCGFKLGWRLVLGKKHVKAKWMIRDDTTGTN